MASPWSIISIYYKSIISQIGDERVFLGDKNAACDTELLARLKGRFTYDVDRGWDTP